MLALSGLKEKGSLDPFGSYGGWKNPATRRLYYILCLMSARLDEVMQSFCQSVLEAIRVPGPLQVSIVAALTIMDIPQFRVMGFVHVCFRVAEHRASSERIRSGFFGLLRFMTVSWDL